ncbi:transcriptional regulator, LysR family [Methylobacterium sp. 4-46]|uniref:LysR family transcriptional regulator n=1 Tax=unclassified Methylobacterium TaxID=2615210 RepID=UPI000152C89F|nr:MULTISPECIES: LysR family transcriptional regulator [Methylobacterium]ACA19138.1 transcriptional regulator, LysR family [Methylobacterium sp. 4-46]WFT78349.1 LysR family transcriptional regulator [Methylobacterium nodulans]
MPHPQVLRDLALFVEVAKRKSFSQAAVALNVPISSLSRRITQFEAAIGLRLLDRTTRKLALTPHGEAYYERAIRVVEEAQHSFDEMIAQARGPSGLLRISVPAEEWVMRHLPGVIGAFLRTHEQVRVHVELRAAGTDAAAEDCDLAILTAPPREASMVARRLGSLETGLFAAPAYLARVGTPRHPGELAQHALLAAAPGGESLELRRDDEVVTVTASGAVSCTSGPLARRFAASGDGLALLPLIDGHGPAFRRVLPEWSGPPVPVLLVTTSHLTPAKARAFIEVAGRELSALLGVAEGLPGLEDAAPAARCA